MRMWWRLHASWKIAKASPSACSISRWYRSVALRGSCRADVARRDCHRGEIGSKAVGQSVLDVAAGLAAQREKWAHAARFFGAIEAQTRADGPSPRSDGRRVCANDQEGTGSAWPSCGIRCI